MRHRAVSAIRIVKPALVGSSLGYESVSIDRGDYASAHHFQTAEARRPTTEEKRQSEEMSDQEFRYWRASPVHACISLFEHGRRMVRVLWLLDEFR